MEGYDRPQNVGYLSEKQLERKCNDLQSRIRGLRRSDKNRLFLEVEYCYLFRELESRKKRKIAHQKFLAKKRDNRAKTTKKVV